MQVSQGKVVGITYTLKLTSGEIADQTTEENPFLFIHGIGQTLEAFDENLAGLTLGADFSFSIAAESGYGVSNPNMVIQIPRSVFEGPNVPSDLLQIGNIVPMQDEHGNPMNGVVREVNDEAVTMDFNHPLADQELHFSGKIVSVRDASPEEMDHGHVHGEGGHHH
jgi:FKBP-type peptidyl-prolyl cis-trans isomerase SlyD